MRDANVGGKNETLDKEILRDFVSYYEFSVRECEVQLP